MTIFRCKMCGGELAYTEGASTCSCEYCGTQQTLPRLDSERKVNLYDRAGHFRRSNDYDKAMGIYNQILNEDDTDAEAYWSIVLCRYGIEYVEDPATHKRVPTVNRTQYTSIYADEDYKAAIRYADAAQKSVYEEEAKTIDGIQKGILEISQQEKPFDVFICYKETDSSGRRTQDSVLANDLYHQLTQEGFKVFFSRITLEDKLGTAYEPYIFAALNSAKVMVVLGTRPEYFNAVWVKNEWSRYLALIRGGAKKTLVPAYRDMDPYDLPEEFSHLQAQDMSRLGFMQDLIRGIKKILAADAPAPEQQAQPAAPVQPAGNGGNAQALLDRGNMALEDGEWEKANNFFEEVLNQNARCAEAYLGEFMAEKHAHNFDGLISSLKYQYSSATTEWLSACPEETVHIREVVKANVLDGYLEAKTIEQEYVFDRSYDSALSCRRSQKTKQLSELKADRLLSRAQQYASGDTKKQIDTGLAAVTAELDSRIAQAEKQDANSIASVKKAYAEHVAKADVKVKKLRADAEAKRESQYQTAVELMNKSETVPDYEKAKKALKAMKGYKDSDELAEKCRQKIDRLNEEKRREEERQAEIKRKEAERTAKKKKTITAIVAAVAVVCIAAFFVVTKVIIPNNNYNAAVALMESGDYEAAISAFEAMDGYKDSDELQASCEIALLNAASVGDSVWFGTYEQDNDTDDGKEDIEWIVLDKDGANILVISKYALDCQRYNTSYTDVTWETCALRGWLNSTFINDAFSAKEQDLIATTTATADQNPEYSTSAGNDTQDQVFLLSITEAEKYFSSDNDRMCVPTAYAIAQGAYTSDSYSAGGAATCWWWLRSPGYDSSHAAGVFNRGSVNCGGTSVSNGDDCVRPAMWINLSAD